MLIKVVLTWILMLANYNENGRRLIYITLTDR